MPAPSHCSWPHRYTLLVPELPVVLASWWDYKLAVGLVFEADDALWQGHVECSSVLDSNTAK